ncbi:GNAT family N-acetyltransferase [Aurantimonas marina]|uniref:hypothetical protein n=1 Tax=Aurantimonas marina TaxID=2780508 RepID=UPI0019D28D09|nr:hypothetical protein [Aurantimonas marina]
MAKKPGRKAFKSLAPKGYRIRMMEPGEAEALLAIRRKARPAAPALPEFIRFLLSHEIFVLASKRDGRPVGFAAAREHGDVCLLVEHCIATPPAAPVGEALIAAVTQRARWFGLLTVGIPATVDNPRNAASNERDGFVTVSRKELEDRLPHRKATGASEVGDLDTPMIWVKWLS